MELVSEVPQTSLPDAAARLEQHDHRRGPAEAAVEHEGVAVDDRWRLLTGRHVLNHTTGLANFRRLEDARKLRFHGDTGVRYGCSGEGFYILQLVLEEGLGLEVGAKGGRNAWTGNMAICQERRRRCVAFLGNSGRAMPPAVTAGGCGGFPGGGLTICEDTSGRQDVRRGSQAAGSAGQGPQSAGPS